MSTTHPPQYSRQSSITSKVSKIFGTSSKSPPKIKTQRSHSSEGKQGESFSQHSFIINCIAYWSREIMHIVAADHPSVRLSVCVRSPVLEQKWLLPTMDHTWFSYILSRASEDPLVRKAQCVRKIPRQGLPNDRYLMKIGWRVIMLFNRNYCSFIWEV